MEPIPKGALTSPPKAPPPSPPTPTTPTSPTTPAVMDSVIAAQQSVTQELQQHLAANSPSSTPSLSFTHTTTPSSPTNTTANTNDSLSPGLPKRPLPQPQPQQQHGTALPPIPPRSSPQLPPLPPSTELKKISPKVVARNPSPPSKSDTSKSDPSKSEPSSLSLEPHRLGAKPIVKSPSNHKIEPPRIDQAKPMAAKPDLSKSPTIKSDEAHSVVSPVDELQKVNEPDKPDNSKASKRMSCGKNLPMPRKLELT